MSLRGGNEVSDAAIHRGSNKAYGYAVHFRYASGPPQAFSPRDDKSGIYHEESEEVEVAFCYCEKD